MGNVHIIAGPTASGKSALSLKIAQEKNGVIINADSIQLYKDLPILTARPDDKDMAQCPHKLYGFMAPEERCTAIAWRNMALKEIEQAQQEQKTPILVGGTGFYIKSLIDGLSPLPEIPEPFRQEIVSTVNTVGAQKIHALLAKKDPVMAQRLNPNDTYRLTRAYEILLYTGKSLAEWQALPKENAAPHLQFHMHLILPDRDILYERCNKRFIAMINQGALTEIEQYTGPDDAPVTRALGYNPLKKHINGDISLPTAIDLAQTETRQYAKRQVTWFRNQIAPQKNIASITQIS